MTEKEIWQIGKNYFIRTVTHHHTDRLVDVTEKEFVLKDAAWIADDGRFANMFVMGDPSEVEPFPDGARVSIGRGALIDMTIWPHRADLAKPGGNRIELPEEFERDA